MVPRELTAKSFGIGYPAEFRIKQNTDPTAFVSVADNVHILGLFGGVKIFVEFGNAK